MNFNRSVIDRFIEVFKTQIALNPVYRTEQISDLCFACMLVEPNIKIQKQCLDVDANGDALPNSTRCDNCYCRPMWCVDCMSIIKFSFMHQFNILVQTYRYGEMVCIKAKSTRERSLVTAKMYLSNVPGSFLYFRRVFCGEAKFKLNINCTIKVYDYFVVIYYRLIDFFCF